MKLERIVLPFEVKMIDGDSQAGEFEGWASTFNGVDSYGDMIAKGAYTKTLDDWRDKGKLPAMLWQHRMDMPIGDYISMKEEDKGLYVRGNLWVKGDQRIEQAVVAQNMMKGTGPSGLSIGFVTKDYEMQEVQGGQIRMIKEIELYEVSVVTYPADSRAQITQAKSLVGDDSKLADIRAFENFLCDEGGLSRKQAKTLLSKGYSTLREEVEKRNLGEGGSSRDDGAELAEVCKTITSLFG